MDRVTLNGTFGSSVASAAVLTADIDVTVTTENSRESGRSRLEQRAVTAVTDIASSESGFARRGDRWSTSVGQLDQEGSDRNSNRMSRSVTILAK